MCRLLLLGDRAKEYGGKRGMNVPTAMLGIESGDLQQRCPCCEEENQWGRLDHLGVEGVLQASRYRGAA